jgi:hypothetical protein
MRQEHVDRVDDREIVAENGPRLGTAIRWQGLDVLTPMRL